MVNIIWALFIIIGIIYSLISGNFNVINNEILVTTALQIDYFLIKWNPYLANLEFTTIAPNAITFWRINTSDGALQYQHANEYNNDDALWCFGFVLGDGVDFYIKSHFK